MTTVALIFLLLLHTRAAVHLARVRFHRDGIWWVHYDDERGRYMSMILRLSRNKYRQ